MAVGQNTQKTATWCETHWSKKRKNLPTDSAANSCKKAGVKVVWELHRTPENKSEGGAPETRDHETAKAKLHELYP